MTITFTKEELEELLAKRMASAANLLKRAETMLSQDFRIFEMGASLSTGSFDTQIQLGGKNYTRESFAVASRDLIEKGNAERKHLISDMEKLINATEFDIK